MKTGWTGHHSPNTIIFTLEFPPLQIIKKHQLPLCNGKLCLAFRHLTPHLIQLLSHHPCFLLSKWTLSIHSLYSARSLRTQTRSKKSQVLHQGFADSIQTMILVSTRSPNHQKGCLHYCKKNKNRFHYHTIHQRQIR